MECHHIYLLIGLFHVVNKTNQKFVNLAHGKSATISTRYNVNYFAPGKAVDGDTSTYPLDCALSASGQKEAWLQVDLGETKNIASISFIHGGLGLNAEPISAQDSGIFADSDGTGIVYLSNGRTTICSERFTPNNAKVVCLIWGFLPDGASLRNSSRSDDIWTLDPRCRGNEVNINQCPRQSRICNEGRGSTVSCERGSTLAGFSVYVSDTQNWTSGSICYQHDIQQIPSNNINIDCITSGCYVTIYNSRNETSYTSVSDNAYINICEIDVQANASSTCAETYHDLSCNMSCSEYCKDRLCDPVTGFCDACIDQRSGDFCENEISVNDPAADAYRGNTDYLIAVVVLSAILIITMIAMIAIILYCINRSSRFINCSNPESEYQNTVITDENHEYNQIQLTNVDGSTEHETVHYLDISTMDATSNTEYIDISLK